MTSTISLARALTTRRKEDAAPAAKTYIGRAASQRGPDARPVKRSEISLPVALISTTNMLSYEAPDIVDAPHVQKMGGRYFSQGSISSVSDRSASSDESDMGSMSASFASYETDATSVDMSSPELCQSSNYLDEFFKSPDPSRLTRSTTSSRASRSTTHSSRPSVDLYSPTLPMRAPSHSKNAHVLSHTRSVQRLATIPTISETRDSIAMFSPNSHTSAGSPRQVSIGHPFGKELEQLNMAAEEFGSAVRDAEADADRSIMASKGLARFCANEYLDEISSIYSFDQGTYQPQIWI